MVCVRRKASDMIVVCEYDGSADSCLLQEYSRQLPLPGDDCPVKGVRWKKRRERILAWMLLAWAVEYEFGKRMTDGGHVPPDQPELRRGGQTEYSAVLSRLDICRTEHGKPYSASHPEIQFNISHCDTACACIVGDAEAGIDVERFFAYRENLARKVCHHQEAELIASMTQEERENQLRYLWSLKESFVKLDGRGLGYGMDRINLAPLLSSVQKEQWRRQRLDGLVYLTGRTSSCTLAACSRDERVLGQPLIFSEKELMERYL